MLSHALLDMRSRIYAIAAATPADHRTVRAYLVAGRRPRGALGERLEAACRQLGIEPPPVATEGAP